MEHKAVQHWTNPAAKFDAQLNQSHLATPGLFILPELYFPADDGDIMLWKTERAECKNVFLMVRLSKTQV